ncbi:MAG: tetratricopeptide repeat protein [Pyrinomonadaceae bacterium]
MKNFAEKSFVAAVLILLALTAGSCVRQEASSTKNPEKAPEIRAEDAGIRAARELIEKMPDSSLGYNRLAVAYIRRARETGDFSLNQKAETAVGRSLEIDPENFEAKKIKASLLLTFHRFDEALEFGRRLQREHPRDSFFYGVLTDANNELGNYEEAVENIQMMVDLRPDMSSYSRVGLVRSLHGDHDGAIEALETAARIADPEDLEAQSWCLVHLGDEFYKTGRFEEAEKRYDAALKLLPDYHLALAAKGKARAAAGDHAQAITFYRRSLERVPLTETVIRLGDLYVKTGEREKAEKQYELAEAIEKNLGNIDQRRLALLWADRDMKLDEALEIARREREKRRDIRTADILAWCLYKKGIYGEAQTAIKDALRLKTNDALIFYHAGMIEKASGNKRAAAEFLRKALELNPAFDVIQAEEARKALEKTEQF